MAAIKKSILSKNPCKVPKFKNGYGFFAKSKKNGSILKKPKMWYPKVSI
jgi:hypothetical protein